jgi:mannitol-1-/sugar-/sorbitol-6-phosphatase
LQTGCAKQKGKPSTAFRQPVDAVQTRLVSSNVTTLRCKAVLFDMDGVLVDSTPAVARVWEWWARKHGFDAQAVVRLAHGRPNSETMHELLPGADHLAETRQVEQRELEDTADIVALPGAAELLRTLPEDRWAVVTSATRELAEVRLRLAGLPLPKNLLTASDLQRGKPHPEPYLKGAALLRVPASECLVVEDSPSGVRSGKAAGAGVLAVCTTMAANELLAAGADWLADNLSALSLDGLSCAAVLSFSLMP